MAYKRFTKVLFIVLNVGAAVVFLLGCIAPYLNPQKWWFISLIGLGFGFLIVTLLSFIFFWLVFRPKLVFISLVALLIGWKPITVFFAFHNPDRFDYGKSKDVLRVVHWNVGRFTEWKRNNNPGSKVRLKMMDLIKEQNADVLCLQEFFHSKDSVYYDNLDYIKKNWNIPITIFPGTTTDINNGPAKSYFPAFPLLTAAWSVILRPAHPNP